jgi:hypothetical protein
MAGRPRKFVPEYYAVVEKHQAENVYAGIIGKGRPSRDQVLVVLSQRFDDFDRDSSTDVLTFILSQSRRAELAQFEILAAPTAKATPIRTGPISERGRKIQSGRRDAEARRKGVALAAAMGLIPA